MTLEKRFWASLALGSALALPATAVGLELPKVGLSYRIDARLDPETRVLKGTEEIRWQNPTDAPVSAVPLHLYLNAFAHSRTTWMNGVAAERFDIDDMLAKEPDPWGYTELTAVRQRVESAERAASFAPIRPDDGNRWDRSLVEIALPAPVPPGGELVLAIDFEARMPIPIARTGGARDFFLVAQWYPKLGVIEPAGVRHAPKARVAAHQFHGPTEFYADFADYDVTFAVPSGWLIGATGRAEGEPAPDGSGLVRARYTQRAVHDFALVLGTGLRDQWARHTPKGGGPAVDVRYIVTAGTEHQIPRWRRAIEGALDVLGSRVGPYPYETLTVIMMPWWAARTSGMEYPTLITSLPGDPLWDRAPVAGMWFNENVAIHEFGHQYFYGLLASNEQEEAFLDEGFNSYWEQEVMRAIYGADASEGIVAGRALRLEDFQSLQISLMAPRIREPMRKVPSFLFDAGTWGPQFYPRPAVTLQTAARLFGQEKVDAIFAEYFRRFAFRHPDTEDFLAVAADAGGPEAAAFLREAFERERIPDFAVADVSAGRWKPPLGRVTTESGPVVITPENRSSQGEVGLDPEAREADGRVMMEITDSGWFRGGQGQRGAVTKVLIAPERGEVSPGYSPSGFHESTVRLEGPGWDNLPVEVEIRFADGAVVRDRWDGKAPWRRYRFLRAAPVRDARIDPADAVRVDVTPQNNARALEADGAFAADWGMWLGAVSQWLAGGLSLWL